MDNAKLELSDIKQHRNGSKVRILMKVLAFYLPDIVAKFKQRHPGINLEILQQGDANDWDICIDWLRWRNYQLSGLLQSAGGRGLPVLP